MQRASDAVPSGMISVIGGRATNYKEICAEAVTHCTVNLNMEKPVCKVANYLFSNARVLAGHDEVTMYGMKGGAVLGLRQGFPTFLTRDPHV